MLTKRSFVLAGLSLVLLFLLVGASSHVPLRARELGPAPDRGDKVEGALLEALADGSRADMVAVFAKQADLAPAYDMDWDSRGEFVYNTLQETAARSQARAKDYLDQQGLDHRTFIVGNELYIWAGDLDAANALAALPEVTLVRSTRTYYVDPIIEEAPTAPGALAWGITDTHADDFWSAFGVQGDGLVVANIDTGVQWDHPALDQSYKCPGDPGRNACWKDPSNVCGGTPCDNNGHGTHTMGTIVADDDPALTWQAGMAPNARWIACKGCESSSCSDFALNACADWIVAPGGNPANRPHVVNNSWGGGGCEDWYLAKVNAWRAAGVFPAFSAGNSGPGCSTLGSPGDYQESFGTAAHDSSRSVANFSSRGPTCYGHEPYTKPNVSAPGVAICSTVPGDGWSCGYSGTSMASPHTAGAVALLWSCNSSLIGDMATTFEALQDTADAPAAGNCGAPPDGEGNYTYGYGYLNILAAGQAYCGGGPSPTSTPTATPTATTPPPTASATPTPSATPTDTPTAGPSPTPTPTFTPGDYLSYLPLFPRSFFASPPPSKTPTPPTVQPTPTRTPTATSSTSTPVPPTTDIPGPTPTYTPTPAPGGIENGDFEQGPVVWAEYSQVGFEHLIIDAGFPSGVSPHGGSWAVWEGGWVNEVCYIEQQFTVPAGTPYLVYWYWIASEDYCGYDLAFVRVEGTTVDQYELCEANNTGGWVAHSVDLSAYVGQPVTLQFRVETDGSLNSNFFIDDVSLEASPLAGPGPQHYPDEGATAPK